jgi:putative ABC transport system permease protein
MLRVTIRGLLAHKLRLVTTAIAIVLGVAFMSGTLVLTATMQSTFDGLFADINAGTDVVVRSTDVVDSGFGDVRGPVDESVLPTVRGVDGVRAAEGDVTGYAQFVGRDGKTVGNPNSGAPTLGFAWGDDEQLNPLNLAEGSAPSGPDQVVIDKGTADKEGFAVGDEVTVLTATGSHQFTVSGIAKFGEVDSPLGATLAVFELPTAQEVLGLSGKFSQILVAGDEGLSQQQLADQVQAALPNGTEAVTGATLIEEQQSSTRQLLSFFNTFLLTFAVIALFVGAFIIYNTFSIIVAQRTKEMALLRAIGAARRQVLASVMVEALLTGLVASAIGVAGGVVLAIGLRSAMAGLGIDIPADGLTLGASAIVTPIVVGVVITLASAFFPALKASRVPPIAAMREVALDESGRSVIRLVIGLAVLVLGLGTLALGLFGDTDQPFALVALGAAVIFLAVGILGPVIAGPLARVIGWPLPRVRGISGQIARENAMRNPRRTAATAAALTIGVGLVSFIMIAASSIGASIRSVVDESFAGDYIIVSTGGFQGGLPPTVAADVADLPEVAAAAALRQGIAEVNGSGTFLAAIGPSFGEIADLGVQQGALADLQEPGTIAVLESTAEDEGWAIGDTVDVVYPDSGAQQLRIVATFEHPELLNNSSFATGIATFDANNQIQLDSLIYVDLADGVSMDQGRVALDSVTAGFPNAEVQDKDEFADSIVGQINQIVALIYLLLVVAVMIAVFGIINTLSLSIFERTRELGLLRAVGMTRAQMRSAVRWESVIIAVLGTVLGLVIGTVFGWSMIRALSDEGLDTFAYPFGLIVLVVVFAFLAGVFAAILPARRASRLNVLQAITTD